MGSKRSRDLKILLRLLVLASGAFVMSSCKDDLNFEQMVPSEIQLESRTFSNRISGECAIDVYSLEAGFAEMLKQSGVSALSNATKASAINWSEDRPSSAKLNFEAWQRRPVDRAIANNSKRQRQLDAVGLCLHDQDTAISSEFDAVRVGSGDGYFTFSKEQDGQSDDNFLVILAGSNLLVVAPH